MGFEKQHIVPQAYLKRFATQNPKNKKYIIGVMDKSLRIFSQSIDNVGFLKNYYDTSFHDDSKYWEHFFANEIEPLYGRKLNSIITKATMSRSQAIVLDEQDKEVLTTMMCFQMLRNPGYIDKAIHSMPKFINEHKKKIIKCNPELTPEQVRLIKKIDYSKEKCKEEVLNIITNSDRYKRFAMILSNKAWFVFFNSISYIMPFITSDKPVVFCKLFPDKKFEFGIGRNDVLIYYPISPSIMIAVYPSSLFTANMKEKSDVVVKLTQKDMRFICNINYHQINDCYMQVFLPMELYNEIKKE